MRYIKLFESFESGVNDDIEDILRPLKDIGIEFQIEENEILGKYFLNLVIDKIKVRALPTIPFQFVTKKDKVYKASFDRDSYSSYMSIYHNDNRGEFIHASHLEIIGHKWKDIRDEVIHLVSFMLDEGYIFFYKNSIKISEVINPKGNGLTWLKDDVLKTHSGKDIEILESLDSEAVIGELRISFAKF